MKVVVLRMESSKLGDQLLVRAGEFVDARGQVLGGELIELVPEPALYGGLEPVAFGRYACRDGVRGRCRPGFRPVRWRCGRSGTSPTESVCRLQRDMRGARGPVPSGGVANEWRVRGDAVGG
jgi:hypothetical protein